MLRDERVEALVPGVANRDARAVCDARIDRLLAAQKNGDSDLLGRELAEAFLLGIWRGRNLVGFDALLADVLGLEVAVARALADKGARALGSPLQRLDDRVIAAWVRAGVALINANATCRVSFDGATQRLQVAVPAENADLYLAEIGKRVVALSKYLPREPEKPQRRERRP